MIDAVEKTEAVTIIEDDNEIYRPDIAVVVNEKDSTFKWNKTARKAATLLSTCRYPFVEVAGMVKLRVAALRLLMRDDEFVAEIQRLISVTGAAYVDNQIQMLKGTAEKLNKELLSRDDLRELQTKDLIRLQNQTLNDIRQVESMNKGKPEEETVDRKIIVKIYQSFNAQDGKRLEATEQGQDDILKLAKGADGIYAPTDEEKASG